MTDTLEMPSFDSLISNQGHVEDQQTVARTVGSAEDHGTSVFPRTWTMEALFTVAYGCVWATGCQCQRHVQKTNLLIGPSSSVDLPEKVICFRAGIPCSQGHHVLMA